MQPPGVYLTDIPGGKKRLTYHNPNPNPKHQK